MPTFAVKQPNGNYALFSTIVDTFTAHGLTRDQAVFLLMERVSLGDALQALDRADDDNDRWKDALNTVGNIHGDEARAGAEDFGNEKPVPDVRPKIGERVFMGWALKNGGDYLARVSLVRPFLPVGPQVAALTLVREDAEEWLASAHKQGLKGARLVRVFRTMR